MALYDFESKTRWKKALVFLASIAIIPCLVYLNKMTVQALGTDMPFIFFYLIPAGLSAWHAGRSYGLFVSAMSGAALFITGYRAGMENASLIFYIWSGTAGFVFCSAFAVLLSALRREIRTQRQFAMEDFLTKASNSRAFYNYAEIEINRIKRYNKPLTIVYIDLDNFKKVNDTRGHMEGDRLLTVIVRVLRNNIRLTDAVARLGGDEFVLLLPEMPPESVEPFMKHITQALKAEIEKYNWPVTFSAGVVTFLSPPAGVGAMINAADSLMYEVKKSGKNRIKYSVYR